MPIVPSLTTKSTSDRRRSVEFANAKECKACLGLTTVRQRWHRFQLTIPDIPDSSPLVHSALRHIPAVDHAPQAHSISRSHAKSSIASPAADPFQSEDSTSHVEAGELSASFPAVPQTDRRKGSPWRSFVTCKPARVGRIGSKTIDGPSEPLSASARRIGRGRISRRSGAT